MGDESVPKHSSLQGIGQSSVDQVKLIDAQAKADAKRADAKIKTEESAARIKLEEQDAELKRQEAAKDGDQRRFLEKGKFIAVVAALGVAFVLCVCIVIKAGDPSDLVDRAWTGIAAILGGAVGYFVKKINGE